MLYTADTCKKIVDDQLREVDVAHMRSIMNNQKFQTAKKVKLIIVELLLFWTELAPEQRDKPLMEPFKP